MSAQQFEHDGFNSPNEVEAAKAGAQHTPGHGCPACNTYCEKLLTPGPWKPSKGLSVIGRPWAVVRDVSPRESFSHYEQLRDETGALLTFETEDEARAAIAKTTGGNV